MPDSNDRFSQFSVEVCDHPYDRGYWDRVLGLGNHVDDESWEDQSEYEQGRDDAAEEMRWEVRNNGRKVKDVRQSLLAIHG